jgi:mannose-6-phosphate isomerase-like protein (cupin superfamily)
MSALQEQQDTTAGAQNVSAEHPRVEIFKRENLPLIRWHENKIGGTNMPWWFYDVSDVSKWFSMMCISVLQPGEAGGFHSHRDETEGPYECWYLVMKGNGELRTEYFDTPLSEFDAAYMPTGASHQFRNGGSEPVWWMTLSSRGGQPLRVDTYELECSEARPGYMEEYERIMAARKARGLPTP